VLKSQLYLLRSKSTGRPEHIAEMSEQMLTIVDSLLQSTDAIVAGLMPRMLEHFGLSAAIDWLVKDFEAKTGIRSSASLPRQDLVLNKDYTIALYRILQEGLTNVAKHAAASKVEVKLSVTDRHVALELSDDGRGIRPADVDREGQGLLGIRERVGLLGGEVEIGTGAAGGACLRAVLPLEDGPSPGTP
jgi:signal transduction histidine kinase